MSSDKRTFHLLDFNVRARVSHEVLNAPIGHVVVIQPETRSLAANAALWAMLSEVAAQVIWHGRKLDADSWKNIFTSSLRKQDVLPNLDGTGFVVMGQSTSGMTKSEMGDLIELITSFGIQHGVEFAQ